MEKKISDIDLIEYLAVNVMGWKESVDWSCWNPLESLDQAWMMAEKLREGDAHEFPLFLSVGDDGGFYHRANINHQYDFTLVYSAVDENPCRAICKAVYTAMEKLQGDETWDKPPYWQMWRKDDTPKVGVGVIIRNSKGQVLLQKRKGSHGAGEWSLPGGHQEVGEGFLRTCRREVREETGLDIRGIEHVDFANNDFIEEGLHYVTLYFEAQWIEGKQVAKIMEPDKCDGIDWFDLDKLPSPLWTSIERVLQELR